MVVVVVLAPSDCFRQEGRGRAQSCVTVSTSALWGSWTTCRDQGLHSRAVGTHSGYQGREAAKPCT